MSPDNEKIEFFSRNEKKFAKNSEEFVEFNDNKSSVYVFLLLKWRNAIPPFIVP